MSVDKIDLTPEDFNALVNENGNKFNSTILEIFSKRADNVEPSNLLNNYQRKSSLYEPSKIDPRVYNEISNIFFDTVSKDFDCIELSPISPLGLNSVLTSTNQNNVLSASRNSEVISDSAIAMALECAYRKKVLKEKIINLASSTRILRTQSYSKGKKSHWSQHFRACSLISSFRNSGYKLFEMFVFQIHNWLNVLENLKDNLEIEKINLNLCYIPLVMEIFSAHNIDMNSILSNTVNPEFDIFHTYDIDLPSVICSEKDINLLKITQDYLISIKNTYNMLNNYVITPLKANHEQVNFNLQLNRKSGLTYYDNICFELEVVFKNGKKLVLVDGGINDWIGKILSDSKEKCITSGMGLEYLGRVYTRKL